MSTLCSPERPDRCDAVYITYWSLRDPLCLSQTLPVLRALAGRGWRLALMTYEQPGWALTPEETSETLERLAQEGIRWIPLVYHKRPRILATLFDALAGAWRALLFARQTGVRLFHSRGTVPGAVAYLASRIAGGLFFNDADGPLSQEYVDAGLWRKGSLGNILTRRAEQRFLRVADAVAVLTERRREEVRNVVRGEVQVLPCAVDLGLFVRDPDPSALRREFELQGTVLVYVGKTGGWYLTDPMLDFVQVAGSVLGEVSLLVLTNQDPRKFTEGARQRGLRCVIRSSCRHEEVARHLSVADAGLSFVLPAPSKAAASPVKNGEYLACGLPIVTTAGIGDYSALVVRRNVGVVLPGLDPDAYRRASEALRHLLRDPELRTRCREVARTEVGLHEVVIPRYAEIYERLLSGGSPGRPQ